MLKETDMAYRISIKIEEIKKETLKGKYIISSSNFGDAYILGIPCKVISDPYPGYNDVIKKKEKYMTVQSCITGLVYKIPFALDWLDVYEDFQDILVKNEDLLNRGYYFCDSGNEKQIIGNDYFPMDNSWSTDFEGNRFPVAGETVTIISLPFEEETEFGRKRFVLVAKEDGKVGKCMFMEWKLRKY